MSLHPHQLSLRAWISAAAAAVMALAIRTELSVAVRTSSYDVNFACCGGCSSRSRADAYSNKLANGAHVFIWDTTLKTDPSTSCLLTFPYDKALNEQEGDRRVRSGQLVGTSYPIDHDFDSLCCEQRGLCRAIEEDATGKCQCVKTWGFTGAHCEFSVYDVAAQNNSAVFPAVTNLTSVDRLLPDLRTVLIEFDMATALTAFTRVDPHDASNLFSLFTFTSEDSISYRQFAYTACSFTAIAAGFVLLLFVVQLVWSYCCFRCKCRKRDPRSQPRIYSKATKIAWGVAMCLLLAVGTGASVVAFLTVHSQLVPGREAIVEILRTTLPTEIVAFQSAILEPFNQVLHAGGSHTSNRPVSLQGLQQRALSTMAPLTFLDAQSNGTDVLSEPVFALLGQLLNYSTLYPTVNADGNTTSSIDCAQMNITPSVVSRMTIGATTGCFRCKSCSQLSELLAQTRDRWRRNAYKNQLDLRDSRQQLIEFGQTQATLTPAIVSFRDRVNRSSSMFVAHVNHVADQYDHLSTEAQQLTVIGLLALLGLCGLALVLSLVAVSVGLRTNKRPTARTTCFVGELACVLAIVLAGVLYSVSLMAHDSIQALELLNRNTTIFVGEPVAAQDVHAWLFDRNLVEQSAMNTTLAFADTLRVPPHPNPTNDDPDRWDIDDMYDLPELFELETQVRRLESARSALFGWEQSFLDAQTVWLLTWAFANDTIKSPYNQTIHQTLLNSSTAQLMDPDNDTKLVTEDDLAYIQTVFNESWRSVSDRGAAQNELVATQWLFVARLEMQKQNLNQYLTEIADVIASPKPLLRTLITSTRELETAEFELKAPVEFFSQTIRAAKLRDCSFHGNCAWFRDTVNELFAESQDLITQAEFAAICCAVGFVALLLGVICTGCFANRLRRNIVKVYSAN